MPSVCCHLGSFVLTFTDQAFDAITVCGGDHRTQLGGGIVERRADFDCFGGLNESRDDPVGGRANSKGHGTRHAALTGTAESRLREAPDRFVHRGVRHEEDEIFGATGRLHPLSMGRAF